MKAIKRTSAQLTLRFIHWFWFIKTFGAIGVIGVMFTMTGVICSSLIGRYSVICDRLPDASGTCEITQSTLWETRRQTFPLKDLQGAEIVSESNSDGDTTYRLFLLLPEKRVALPLGPFAKSRSSQADLINQFVQDSTQSNLAIADDWFWFIISGFILFCGISLILGGKDLIIMIRGKDLITILKFDNLSNQLILIRRGLLGSKRIEHPLWNIAHSYIEMKPGLPYTYRINLMLTSGETLALTPYSSSSGYDENLRITQEIHSFLGIEKAVPIDPRSLPYPGDFDFLGLMLMGNHKRQQRLEEYQARISHQPEDIKAHYKIAHVLALQGKEQEAKAHLEKFRSQFAEEGKFELAQLLDQQIALMNSEPHTPED